MCHSTSSGWLDTVLVGNDLFLSSDGLTPSRTTVHRERWDVSRDAIGLSNLKAQGSEWSDGYVLRVPGLGSTSFP
jgi:hypothetical protein